MRNGKAAGIDGVSAELIKQAGSSAVSFLHELCNKAWSEEKFPAIWCKSVIVPLRKKGDLKLCENTEQSV